MRSTFASLLASVALISGVVVTASGVSSAAPTWSITPSPSPFHPANVPLADVSCSSPTSCFAVGTVTDPYGVSSKVVIEQWDGTTWLTVPSPDPAGASLNGVSCLSATRCVVVGHSDAGTLTEAWDGASWAVVASPNPSGSTSATLSGVSCSSATSCFAVGSYDAAGSKYKTLIEHWNGTSWSIVASPNPSGAVTAYLADVSCLGPASCFAVGGHVEAGDNKGGPLVVRWNGTNWQVLPVPPPKVRSTSALLGVTPRLTDVSCTTATSCMAVGFTASDGLIERWNGTKWTRVANAPQPNSYDLAEFHSVSCSSAANCFAVGVIYLPVDEREGVEKDNSIIEHWNGKAWSIMPRAQGVPTTKFFFFTGELSRLNGVSCATATSCAAVGNSAMAERWNGTKWSLAPLVGSTSYSQLAQVSCATSTTCFAVGTTLPLLGVTSQTLVERWNGTAWSTVPSPTPTGVAARATLSDISCPSPTNCTAVGEWSTELPTARSNGHVLIEHWNGAQWSIAAAPNPPNSSDPILSSVSCPTETSCFAVGRYQVTNTGHSPALVERWNGKTWSIVPTPSPTDVTLNAVSCSSATSCFAVGASAKGALVERWDGAKWSIVATPKPTGTFIQLRGVSCSTATHCAAVGFSQSVSQSALRPVAEQWNGTSWTITSIPDPSDAYTELSRVSCSSPTTCVAIGISHTNTPTEAIQTPLLEQWDGAGWSIVASPTPAGSTSYALNGVTCPNTTGCIAVGNYMTSDSSYTLIERGP